MTHVQRRIFSAIVPIVALVTGSVTVDATTILSGATYDPFGPVNGWSWGNSTAHSRSFDLRGLMDSQSVVTDTRTLGYDDAGRLITLDDARHDLGFDYNVLGQLTDFTASGSAPLPASQDFTYDENGNRESLTEGSTYTYSLVSNSNRLTSTTGPTAKSYTYDAAGNVTSDSIHSYGYDDRGRLVSFDSGAVTYQHNGQGQRVKKDDGSNVTLFAYDEAGQLIGEYDDTGTAILETVWFNGASVAVLAGANKYYVHTDHLGTPRAISNGNTVIWRWESDPFGSTAPQEDPDGDLTDFVYNLRFPGQYYDAETGLHYNYFRDYDPTVGRYIQSDPIGLAGGINSYGYALQNPLGYTDPTGEFVDAFVDLGFLAYDLYRLIRDNLIYDCDNLGENVTAFGADLAGFFIPGATGLGVGTRAAKASKIEKSTKTEHIGRFTRTTEVRPGRDPGQTRAEYVRYKNDRGETIRTYKDTYDRAGNFIERKPLRGGPEGRPVGE